MNKLLLLLLGMLVFVGTSVAQGSFTGSFEANTNFYIRDTSLPTASTPHYENQLSGTDAWLALNYSNYDLGLDAGVRLDVFNNSNLHNPTVSFTGAGIGRYFISKKVGKLTATGGYIYDQIGSGMVFRAFEERPLGVDNAILGMHALYQINDNWMMKGFTGKQKNRFEEFNPVIKGYNIEGYESLGERVSIAPGFGVVNRTLDASSMSIAISNIESYDSISARFVPNFNSYAMTFYNRLTIGNWDMYGEYAIKTGDIYMKQDGFLDDEDGTAIYAELGYSTKGFGASLQARRLENFNFRTSPEQSLQQGLIGFMPPLARQNTYRLTARYNAAAQDLGESAVQLDIVTTLKKGLTLTVNGAHIRTLDDEELFTEAYFDFSYKVNRKTKVKIGNQYIRYNQFAYQQNGDELLTAVTPFTEVTYKFTKRKSLRIEASYMSNAEDFGSWAFGLLEYNVAPKFSFGVSDMYNIAPTEGRDKVHYYSAYGNYIKGTTRFTMSYVRQVEGVVCTGGVCRFEPAFNGARFQVSSTF